MRIQSQYKTCTDEELMEFIQQHSHKAFNELYDRYAKRLFYFMLTMLNRDEEKANDLLQDLFLKIAERPHLFDTNKKFYTWVFTIAANMCRTSHRDQKKTISTEEPEVSGIRSNVEELIGQVDAGVFQQHLGNALDALTYEHKETFLLRFQEGFSLKEIAEMMNCSEGTVKSRIFYTTKKLAEELKAFQPLLKK